MTKRRIGGLILGVAAGASSVFVALTLHSGEDPVTSRAGEEPIYYVDGAHPTADISKPSAETDGAPEGCVPYSADRPDYYVCADLPPDWEPPPEPYFDKAICDAAFGWMSKQEDEEFATAKVDAGSCFVAEGGPYWDVIFPQIDGTGNVHVPFDPTGKHPFMAGP